jgi:peptidoglycan hydrolase-like protein with peptidoglycan-binding domain
MSAQRRLSTLSSAAVAVALVAVGVAPLAQAQTLPLALRPALAAAAPAPPTKALPTAVDVKTPYQGQVSCDPRPKPGVTAFKTLMLSKYKTGTIGTFRPCLSVVSEHYDGRAMDWMLNVNNASQKAVANSVTAWLSANGGVMARRFGITYMIWNKKVFKLYKPEAGWTKYTGAVPHTDHIHFSFSWNGAMKRTSWWTGKALTTVDVGPCQVYTGQFAPLYTSVRTASCSRSLLAAPKSPYKVAAFGQKSTQIATAQKRLGVKADGQFGTATFNKLRAWQPKAKVPVTGVLDKATWAKLIKSPVVPVVKPAPPKTVTPKGSASTTRYTASKKVVLKQGSKGAAVKVLQKALKLTADGAFGPKTKAAVVKFQKAQKLTANGTVGLAVWNRLEKRDYPLIAYRKVTLKQGSKVAAVKIVQRALKLTADGAFGAKTTAAVKALQLKAKLPRTGVVSGWTWVHVENRWRAL